jgi:uncharacterized NAD(P)/FAD-binding protein YdhS
MTEAESRSFVAECFWPGVRGIDLHALDRRAAATAAEAGGVVYLGSILMRDDEVVLCHFRGPAEAVALAARRAEIPFSRILETAQAPWPNEKEIQ